jgi:cobyrinic acid a,c-diamide synthase
LEDTGASVVCAGMGLGEGAFAEQLEETSRKQINSIKKINVLLFIDPPRAVTCPL